MKAIVSLILKRTEYQPMDGLRLLPNDRGATAWTILSCPTEIYRKGLKFFHDAFAIISAGKKLEDWKITLYNQDTRTKKGFLTKVHSFFFPEEAKKEAKQDF